MFGSFPSFQGMDFLTWTFQDVSVFFQMAGISPTQDQVNRFLHYLLSAEPDQCSDRYRHETRRYYRVLDEQLQECGGQNIIGDRCTIADLATLPFVHTIGNWSPRSHRILACTHMRHRVFWIEQTLAGSNVGAACCV